MTIDILFMGLGLVLVGCVFKQRLALLRLNGEVKDLRHFRKHARCRIRELKDNLNGSEYECDILRNENNELRMSIKKTKGICERLWDRNVELMRGTNVECCEPSADIPARF